MPLHVTPDTEGLAAAGVGALERFLARVGVAVDAQRAGARECLVACLADVAILGLREGRGRRGRNVVVVLPRVGARGWHCDAHGHWRKSLRGC